MKGTLVLFTPLITYKKHSQIVGISRFKVTLVAKSNPDINPIVYIEVILSCEIKK